jgi:hypothetical protein
VKSQERRRCRLYPIESHGHRRKLRLRLPSRTPDLLPDGPLASVRSRLPDEVWRKPANVLMSTQLKVAESWIGTRDRVLNSPSLLPERPGPPHVRDNIYTDSSLRATSYGDTLRDWSLLPSIADTGRCHTIRGSAQYVLQRIGTGDTGRVPTASPDPERQPQVTQNHNNLSKLEIRLG